jgi:hypothetical protein
LFAEDQRSTGTRQRQRVAERSEITMHTLHRQTTLFRLQYPRLYRGITTLRSTRLLPNHVTPTTRHHPPLSGTPPPTFPFLNPELAPPRPNGEELSPAGRLYKLTWPRNLRNLLVVKKRRDEKVKEAAIVFAQYEHTP